MRKLLCHIVLLLFLSLSAGAQELFPNAEPASNVPKGDAGIRAFSETYNEINRVRNLFALRIMYGATSKLSIYATPNVSNHHNKLLPPEFPVHNTPNIGVTHPYRFNGADFYAKYRFFSHDGENSHLRMAAYGEYSLLKVAHDEGEPTLLDDNSGYGAGLIATYLKHHFAVSLTGGCVVPFKYRGYVQDEIPALPPTPATVTYSNATTETLSFGYLLYPGSYENYSQTNWNVYMEFIGKQYGAATMQVGSVYYSQPQYSITTAGNKALQGNQYIEAYPAVQAIIHSELRIDFSLGFPVASRSYVHFYPVYNVGVQRYFNFRKSTGR